MHSLDPEAPGRDQRAAETDRDIPLPNVEGYFDHMAVDITRGRLKLSSCTRADWIHTIPGFGGDPRKTLYLPETNEIRVDDGDRTCKAFSGDTYQLIKNIPLSGADLDQQD